jgi:hypothetical protein
VQHTLGTTCTALLVSRYRLLAHQKAYPGRDEGRVVGAVVDPTVTAAAVREHAHEGVVEAGGGGGTVRERNLDDVLGRSSALPKREEQVLDLHLGVGRDQPQAAYVFQLYGASLCRPPALCGQPTGE